MIQKWQPILTRYNSNCTLPKEILSNVICDFFFLSVWFPPDIKEGLVKFDGQKWKDQFWRSLVLVTSHSLKMLMMGLLSILFSDTSSNISSCTSGQNKSTDEFVDPLVSAALSLLPYHTAA